MNNFSFRKLPFAIVLCTLSHIASAQTTAYDSTNDDATFLQNNVPDTYGQALILTTPGLLNTVTFDVGAYPGLTAISGIFKVYDDTSGAGPASDPLLASSTDSFSFSSSTNLASLTVNFGSGIQLPKDIFVTEDLTSATGAEVYGPAFDTWAPNVGTNLGQQIYFGNSLISFPYVLAFKVTETQAVPEPPSLAIISVATLGIFLRKRK